VKVKSLAYYESLKHIDNRKDYVAAVKSATAGDDGVFFPILMLMFQGPSSQPALDKIEAYALDTNIFNLKKFKEFAEKFNAVTDYKFDVFEENNQPEMVK
jgi:hypothetical protein